MGDFCFYMLSHDKLKYVWFIVNFIALGRTSKLIGIMLKPETPFFGCFLEKALLKNIYTKSIPSTLQTLNFQLSAWPCLQKTGYFKHLCQTEALFIIGSPCSPFGFLSLVNKSKNYAKLPEFFEGKCHSFQHYFTEHGISCWMSLNICNKPKHYSCILKLRVFFQTTCFCIHVI